MIPLNFGLFFSGDTMSYLRYLTFKSLKHFHPDANIILYTTDEYSISGHNWSVEKQDFEATDKIKSGNYFPKIKDLEIKIQKMGFVNSIRDATPNVQSDMFRWWFLKEVGGFYLDCDQIITKPFNTLNLDTPLLYVYDPKTNYTPVGVIGGTKESKIVQFLVANFEKFYSKEDYNSTGPWMFIRTINMFKNEPGYNAPREFFYPVIESGLVTQIYNGSLKLTDNNYAIHWFGGHPKSQEFNNKYTEEFAKTSNDTISRFLREEKII